MRASVVAAWPAMCRRFEGVTTWMYLDTKGLVTTGVGFLINTVAGAQALPWKTKDGKPATAAQIKTEWDRVHGQQAWKKYNGLNSVWRNSAMLSLDMSVVDAKLLETTATFWKRLGQTLPAIESFPADAQLALMDLAWQNGSAFLDSKSGGKYVWTNMRAGSLAQDWTRCASAVPGNDDSDRKVARKRLFSNAAAVVKMGLDPEVLWDSTVPRADWPVPTPTTDPDPEPVEEAPVALSMTKKVRWKTTKWYVDERTHAQLEAVEEILGHPIVMYQGSWSNGSLSADTHAGAGATDIGPTGGVTWRELETACRMVGLAAWWRHTGSFAGSNQHCHALSIGNPKLASWAKVQVSAYLDGYDGLGAKARSGKDTGNRSYVKVTWDDVEEEYTMPTAKEIAKAVVEEIVTNEKAAERLVIALANADVFTNQWTANKDGNPTVSGLTMFDRLGRRTEAIQSAVVPQPPVSEPEVKPTDGPVTP